MKKQTSFLFGILLILSITSNVSAQIMHPYISEIMYDSPLIEDKNASPNEHNNGEYVKLSNPTNHNIDLSGWVLSGTNQYEQFVFPANTIIKAKDILIVAYLKSNSGFDFRTYYNLPTTTSIINQSAIILYNKGEILKLYDQSNKLTDIVTYGNLSSNKSIDVFANESYALKRTYVSYSEGTITSLGNTDLTYGDATPSTNEAATIRSTTPSSDAYFESSNGSSVKVPGTEIKLMDVAKPVAWFITKPLTENLDGAYYWFDKTKNNSKLLIYDSNGAGTGSEYIVNRNHVRTYNFNPALDLTQESKSKEILIKGTNLNQATIIGVWGTDGLELNTDKYMFTLNGRKEEGLLITKSRIVPSIKSGKSILNYGGETTKSFKYQEGGIETASDKFHEGALRIGTFFKNDKPEMSIWGEDQKAVISMGNTFLSTNVNNTSTFDNSQFNSSHFTGYTPELLIYDKVLKPFAQSKIESYLAIKYGLTLDKSYYNSEGNLIWDYQTNNGFNNRIAGYERDDANELYQKRGTTSYEEAPFYTSQESGDSFDGNSSFGAASRNRLLVVGCQPGNTLNNNNYVLFGDNDQALTTENISGSDEVKYMQRKWLITTNKKDTINQMVWNTAGLTLTAINTYKSSITKTGRTTIAQGTIVTNTTLKGENGYLSWTVGTFPGPLTVKFGTNNGAPTAGTNDYGYYISSSGQVFSIEKGVKNNTSLLTLSTGQKVEFEKNNDILFLRINGLKNTNSQFKITYPADLKSLYYGSLMIGNYAYDITVSDILHGGFTNTGNRIELSYLPQKATEFANYKNGKAYLIIDRAGDGDFSTSNADLFQVDEIDEIRSKLIFNNIFWDTDKNGKDQFTFGYMSNFVTQITNTLPTCTDGVPQNNGTIGITVTKGIPGYKYTLTGKNSGNRTGLFFNNTSTISDMVSDEYKLRINEIGGANFSKKTTSSLPATGTTTNYFTSLDNSSIECYISDATINAFLGFTASTSVLSSSYSGTYDYGIYINGGYMYAYFKGTTTKLDLLTKGDCLKVIKRNGSIYFSRNGREFFSVNVTSVDISKYFYGYVYVNSSSNSLNNVICNGVTSSNSWYISDNTKIDISLNDYVEYDVNLTCNCSSLSKSKSSQAKENDIAPSGETKISVYYKDITDLSNVTVSLELEKPTPATILLFDWSGKQIYNKEINASTNLITADMRLPMTGVYIVKVITSFKEYSQKVISLH